MASLSALAGNYTTILRPEGSMIYPVQLKPRVSDKFCRLFQTYRYEILIDAGGGEVRLMILSLEGFLSSNALVNITTSGSERLSFKPDRRGVYITVIENVGDEEASVGYMVTFTRELEKDFLQDSIIVASAGALITIIGLTLERALKGRRGEKAAR